MHTFSQRLGSFPTKSRVEIFSMCRQDYPLRSPINRGGLALREEKIESKVNQKTASLPCFSPFLSSLSLLAISLPHLQPPPLSPPSFPLQSTPQLDAQPPSSLSLSPSLLCKTLLPLPATTNASYRPHHLHSHRAPPARPPTPSTLGKLLLLFFFFLPLLLPRSFS